METKEVHVKGVLPWLVHVSALVFPVQNIIFLTIHYFTSFVPIARQAGQEVVPRRLFFQTCYWVECKGTSDPSFYTLDSQLTLIKLGSWKSCSVLLYDPFRGFPFFNSQLGCLLLKKIFKDDIKGTVQRELRWVKIGINRTAMKICIAGKYRLPCPKGHHHERSINILCGCSTFWRHPNRLGH